MLILFYLLGVQGWEAEKEVKKSLVSASKRVSKEWQLKHYTSSWLNIVLLAFLTVWIQSNMCYVFFWNPVYSFGYIQSVSCIPSFTWKVLALWLQGQIKNIINTTCVQFESELITKELFSTNGLIFKCPVKLQWMKGLLILWTMQPTREWGKNKSGCQVQKKIPMISLFQYL